MCALRAEDYDSDINSPVEIPEAQAYLLLLGSRAYGLMHIWLSYFLAHVGSGSRQTYHMICM